MDYSTILFEDEFEADCELCDICGNDAMPRSGYNEKQDLLKFECPECGGIFIEDGKGDTVIVRGEKRDWPKYLAENLNFPFDAIVMEASDEEMFGIGKPGPIRYGDVLTVMSVDFEDALYGVLVTVKKGRKKYSFPLMDLAAKDKDSHNAKLISKYGTLLSSW